MTNDIDPAPDSRTLIKLLRESAARSAERWADMTELEINRRNPQFKLDSSSAYQLERRLRWAANRIEELEKINKYEHSD